MFHHKTILAILAIIGVSILWINQLDDNTTGQATFQLSPGGTHDWSATNYALRVEKVATKVQVFVACNKQDGEIYIDKASIYRSL